MRSTFANLGDGEEGVVGGMAIFVYYEWAVEKEEENKNSNWRRIRDLTILLCSYLNYL